MKFLIVDQTLAGFDGHHFEYDESVARAAGELGFEVTIAGNRRCDPALTSSAARIVRHFKHGWGDAQQSALVRVGRSVLSVMPDSVRQPAIRHISGALRTVRRHTSGVVVAGSDRLPDFGRELDNLLTDLSLGGSDQVLIHTLNSGEFLALLERLVDREVLPHFHIVLRRDADEADLAGGRWGGLPAILGAINRAPDLISHLHLYCDTTQLCEQYEARLPGLKIRLLPIPHGIPETILPKTAPQRAGQPVCVTYLGNARTEKGFDILPGAVEAIYETHVATGRVRLVLQSNANLSLEEGVIADARRKLAAYPGDKVTLLNAPLSISEFQGRLEESDVILLPYRKTYYQRRSSGVLVQALVSGRPVIVPSGTWLSQSVSPNASVVFDEPNDLGAAIGEAVERLPAMRSAAAEAAQSWRLRHSPEALVKVLLQSVSLSE